MEGEPKRFPFVTQKGKGMRINILGLDWYTRKVKRHEILHAFAAESGLNECSDWARNEEMIDWIAYQGLKVIEAWKAAGAI